MFTRNEHGSLKYYLLCASQVVNLYHTFFNLLCAIKNGPGVLKWIRRLQNGPGVLKMDHASSKSDQASQKWTRLPKNELSVLKLDQELSQQIRSSSILTKNFMKNEPH